MVRTMRRCRWLGLALGLVAAAGLRAAPPDDGLPTPPAPARARSSYLPGAAPTAPKPTALPAAQEVTAPAAPPVIERREGSDSSRVIERRLDPAQPDAPPIDVEPDPAFRYPIEPPLGFTGPTSILPEIVQGDSDFVPMPDRWRSPFPSWDRYGNGNPPINDIPYELGQLKDPYNQNVLKGDYPIIGQHTFFVLTATSLQLLDTRQTPLGTTPFESTANPFQEEFFGSPNQLVYLHFLKLTMDLNHGDAAFKPTDWRIRVTPIFNVNTFNVSELAIVNPNVEKGVQRDRTFLAIEEYFVETKLTDLSVYYDFMSVRAGSQFFNHDQFNVALFRQAEKDTNSQLNTLNDRGQNILLANYYRQDFIWSGYTTQLSILYNHDPRSFKFDRNNFLVRPDPVGVFTPHSLDVVYFGWAGEGHIERYNVSHQVYFALGHDTLNPIANQAQSIRGWFGALELSYDRDWARFRTSFLVSSGDENPNNGHATGFDTVLDNPNFAGGQFSFWQRQAIRLFGVNLVQQQSLIPDLRSSKIQGQSNFVNPGLFLYNIGFDADLTPKLKSISNVNFLYFMHTEPLEVFLFDGNLNNNIGVDLSTGIEYRPLLSNNVIVTAGVSTLVPGAGFKALYNKIKGNVDPLVAGFMELALTY
jgi:hypothetical protein